ncbi:spore coat protein [bacterium BFN5]|nr:spore coat protein [bacterium BFN5]QJW44976.1 spore coat protein [bacterium BFN5]
MKPTNRYLRTNSQQNQLSDRDMLFDLLSTEKHMSHMYDHGIMESTNTDVRYTFEELQHDEHENAHIIFNSMQERGWYNTNKKSRTPNSNYLQVGRSGRSIANSEYAVTSGAQKFGSRLDNNVRYRNNEGRRVTNNSFI